MADYALSNKADADLTEIYLYTFRAFGEAQADSYAADLIGSLQRLADRPGLGRDAAHLLPGLRRYEHASHIVFYQIDADGLFVIRILHRSMEPARHLD